MVQAVTSSCHFVLQGAPLTATGTLSGKKSVSWLLKCGKLGTSAAHFVGRTFLARRHDIAVNLSS